MNESTQPPDSANARSNQFTSRMKMLALLGAFGFPLLLATVWLQVVKAKGGDFGVSVKGELIRPAYPLEPFELTEQGKDTFNQESLRGIWTMLYAPVGECVDTCQKNLYHMRQVRLALNHRKDRLQRAVLLESPGQLTDVLISEHPGLRVLSGERAVLMGQFATAEGEMPASEDAIYLIDPFGNLMMRFPADLPPKSMLKDVKHLLKVSRIG